MLAFLASRAVSGVECVNGQQYLRSMAVRQGGVDYRGWVSVQPDEARNRVRVEMAPTLSRVTTEVLRRVRQLFDLDAAPDRIAAALGGLAADSPGLRLPGCVDSFEQATRAVLGQLVSVKMAAVFAGRIADHWGSALEQPHGAVTHLFPDAARVAQLQPEELRPLGVQLKRAAALIALASAVSEGRLELDNVLDIEQGIKNLLALPGIGSWTASYIAMRAWSWPDVFLASDYLIKQRFPGMTPRQIERYAERWRPWRSYATLHLWHNGEWVP
jgi:AraC family transcriptional regulator of adaptative response / DNA-3-methyladenine glycosylase II